MIPPMPLAMSQTTHKVSSCNSSKASTFSSPPSIRPHFETEARKVLLEQQILKNIQGTSSDALLATAAEILDVKDCTRGEERFGRCISDRIFAGLQHPSTQQAEGETPFESMLTDDMLTESNKALLLKLILQREKEIVERREVRSSLSMAGDVPRISTMRRAQMIDRSERQKGTISPTMLCANMQQQPVQGGIARHSPLLPTETAGTSKQSLSEQMILDPPAQMTCQGMDRVTIGGKTSPIHFHDKIQEQRPQNILQPNFDRFQNNFCTGKKASTLSTVDSLEPFGASMKSEHQQEYPVPMDTSDEAMLTSVVTKEQNYAANMERFGMKQSNWHVSVANEYKLSPHQNLRPSHNQTSSDFDHLHEPDSPFSSDISSDKKDTNDSQSSSVFLPQQEHYNDMISLPDTVQSGISSIASIQLSRCISDSTYQIPLSRTQLKRGSSLDPLRLFRGETGMSQLSNLCNGIDQPTLLRGDTGISQLSSQSCGMDVHFHDPFEEEDEEKGGYSGHSEHSSLQSLPMPPSVAALLNGLFPAHLNRDESSSVSHVSQMSILTTIATDLLGSSNQVVPTSSSDEFSDPFEKH